MKRLLMFLSIMLSFITAFSQEASPLSVKDFIVRQGETVDVDLIPEDSRTDWDSNPVCLVIVKVSGVESGVVNKLIFVPNGIDIMHKTIKNGQVWLYVSSNKIGEIKTVYLGDCVFALPYKLKAHQVYELSLGMATANIVVRTTPAEAVILVDGENAGQGYANAAVAIGTEHRIKVQCNDYYPFEDMYKFDEEEKVELDVKLVPNFGYLTVKSQPEGAEVYIDGEHVGTTPFMLGKVRRGHRRLEVRKKTYISYVQIVNIKKGETQTVENVVLEPNEVGYGSIFLTSEPDKAIVSIEGRQYGRTPLTIPQLEDGTYDIMFSKRGCDDLMQTVTIFEGVSDTLSVIMNQVSDDDSEESDNLFFTVKNATFEMVSIEGGTFQMGCDSGKEDACNKDEIPAHKVTLSDFYIGKIEVTHQLWLRVMGNCPYNTLPDKAVQKVSWDDCQKFIVKLNELTGQNFRMPTEAEWEYVARGGKDKKNAKELGVLNFDDDVAEWCGDWYGKYTEESQTNPTGPKEGRQRVYRGVKTYEKYKRPSYRHCHNPDENRFQIGLRLVLVR